MLIEPISGLPSGSFFSNSVSNKELGSFEKLLNSEIKQIDASIEKADVEVRKLAVGETDNIHQVMLSVSKAQTSFELAVQIRNKVIEGTQELLRMSI
ncbi:flagellar hook-basal body complex protein FliE [Cellvibrio sp. KY-GH-1]|uniref:flagellar hook-basal body complex protein FliE n=1 Tax=Cellvibrio sp. KY-GH-1 TaxID=2303332 RepID=UPI001786F9E9|nr:flagellar hook-basal body complex protein FliE [Cellvibrio sp. KY-GH-1]